MVSRIVELEMDDFEFDGLSKRETKIMKKFLKGELEDGITLKQAFRIYNVPGTLEGEGGPIPEWGKELYKATSRILKILEENPSLLREMQNNIRKSRTMKKNRKPEDEEEEELKGVVKDIFTKEELELLFSGKLEADIGGPYNYIEAAEPKEPDKYEVGEAQREEEEKKRASLPLLPDPDRMKRTGLSASPAAQALDEANRASLAELYPEQWGRNRQILPPTQGHVGKDEEEPEKEPYREEKTTREETGEKKRPPYAGEEEFEDEKKQTGVPDKKAPKAVEDKDLKEPKKVRPKGPVKAKGFKLVETGHRYKARPPKNTLSTKEFLRKEKIKRRR